MSSDWAASSMHGKAATANVYKHTLQSKKPTWQVRAYKCHVGAFCACVHKTLAAGHQAPTCQASSSSSTTSTCPSWTSPGSAIVERWPAGGAPGRQPTSGTPMHSMQPKWAGARKQQPRCPASMSSTAAPCTRQAIACALAASNSVGGVWHLPHPESGWTNLSGRT